MILHPDHEDLQKFGVLAHVDANERQRIMNLPQGQTKQAIANLEREVEKAKKKEASKPKSSVQFRAITDSEAKHIKSLQGVSFQPGSPDKSFSHSMAGKTQISEKQAEYLRKIVYKYRGQL